MATPPLRVNGVQLAPQSSNPLSAAGQNGIYFDNASTNVAHVVINGVAFVLSPTARVATTGGLTSGLAGQIGIDGAARVTSTKQVFVTEDGVNWTAYS